MKRYLKALGLAMVAVFALSAVAASAAQAAKNTHHFTTEAPAIITGVDEGTGVGEEQPKFEITINGSPHWIKCTTGRYDATVTEKTNTSVTVTPTYSGCENDLGIKVTVDVNHCAYVLEGTTNASGHAGLEIECAAGNQIEITYPLFGQPCTVDVGPQTVTGLHYTQTTHPTTGKKDITIKATVTGISYKETGPFPCPNSATRTDATFNGGITAQAYVDNNGAGCAQATSGTERTTPPSHETTTGCEGAAQDLELNENVTEP